ncbi:MAG TPA: hypothetical protein VGI96_18575 [Streptosporangiaceae bacterium]
MLLAEPAFEHLAGDTDRDRFQVRRLDIGERRLTQTVQDLDGARIDWADTHGLN